MSAAAAVANTLKGEERARMKSIQYHTYYTLKQKKKKTHCCCLKTSNNSQLDHQKPYSQ